MSFIVRRGAGKTNNTECLVPTSNVLVSYASGTRLMKACHAPGEKAVLGSRQPEYSSNSKGAGSTQDNSCYIPAGVRINSVDYDFDFTLV